MKPFQSKWLEPIIFGLLVSCLLSLLASGLSTMILAGINRDLPIYWLATWLPSWAIAFPTVLVIAPLARKIAKSIVMQG